MHALCTRRLDQGWREVHEQIRLIVESVERARTEKFQFFPHSSIPHLLVRSNHLEDIDMYMLPEYDTDIRECVRYVYGMRVTGDEDRTLMACRAWQYWGDLVPGLKWWGCPACKEAGPWQRTYYQPEGGVDQHDPRDRPDNVHPVDLVLRECAHCCRIEEGNPPFWT